MQNYIKSTLSMSPVMPVLTINDIENVDESSDLYSMILVWLELVLDVQFFQTPNTADFNIIVDSWIQTAKQIRFSEKLSYPCEDVTDR